MLNKTIKKFDVLFLFVTSSSMWMKLRRALNNRPHRGVRHRMLRGRQLSCCEEDEDNVGREHPTNTVRDYGKPISKFVL